SSRGEEIENKEVIIRELEDSIRVVLGNLDNLQPFATEHFIVFPYKSKWERVSHLKFKHGEIVLIPYPFVFTLYVEMKWFHENMSPGKPVNDSPGGLMKIEKEVLGEHRRKFGHTFYPTSQECPLLNRTEKEKPSRSGRRPWSLILLMSKNRILSWGTAWQGQFSHHWSKTIHLLLKNQEPVASLGF
uniref:Membrane anchored junction protein n=1 Tax=Otolemur garnettii TaxID=30611 RepID=H0XCA1_OTOGA